MHRQFFTIILRVSGSLYLCHRAHIVCPFFMTIYFYLCLLFVFILLISVAAFSHFMHNEWADGAVSKDCCAVFCSNFSYYFWFLSISKRKPINGRKSISILCDPKVSRVSCKCSMIGKQPNAHSGGITFGSMIDEYVAFAQGKIHKYTLTRRHQPGEPKSLTNVHRIYSRHECVLEKLQRLIVR